jgi:alpha-ketoglutarate-dependent taurine dioxygenase
VNTTTVLDLIAARETAASAALDELREQQAKLTAEVAAIECELADLATTHQTLTKILEHEVTASEPAVISEPYQQILAVFSTDRGALRAKDVCLALSLLFNLWRSFVAPGGS